MESAVEAMVREARRHRAQRILRAVLDVGVASGADPDAMRFAFPIVARGTLAEGAELALRPISGRELLLVHLEMS